MPLEIDGSIVGTLGRAHHVHGGAGAAAGHRRGRALRVEPARARRARRVAGPAQPRRGARAARADLARTSSTTRSPRSPRSSAPTRCAPASCSSSSPTSPATRSAPRASTRRCQDELNNIERYIRLEKARFGNRLNIKLQIAPEVLSVVLPFLALQPLVENAVRHGLAEQAERRHDHDHRGERGRRVRDHRRGRRRRHGPLAAAPTTSTTRTSPARTSGWATSTTGCARPSATTSAWWSTPNVGAGHEDHAARAEVPGGHPGLTGAPRPSLAASSRRGWRSRVAWPHGRAPPSRPARRPPPRALLGDLGDDGLGGLAGPAARRDHSPRRAPCPAR